MREQSTSREEHFQVHCLAWAALRHFLSADLLNELSNMLVEAVGGGQFRLNQLFEGELVIGISGLESWAVRPLEVKDPLAQYLQHRIRYFIWESDTEVFYDQNRPQPATSTNPAALEDAVRLGQCDLNVPEQFFAQLKLPPQSSVEVLASAIRSTRMLCSSPNEAERLTNIIGSCNTVDMPLAAVIMKHLGDLCVDADQCDIALQFYTATSHQLESSSAEPWSKYVNILKGITTQSIAAALRAVRGPLSASAYLAAQLETVSFSGAPLFLLNVSHDAYVAESLASEPFRFVADVRASMLKEPLLLQAQDLSSAFEAWTQQEFSTAHRNFWSILRRQIALGSASDTRMTQAYYAKSIFGALETSVGRELNRDLFIMGVRLFVQSAQTSAAEKMEWSERLVGSYIDDETVALLLSQTNAVEASKDERLGVAIELLRGWCLALPPEQTALAVRMLSVIAKTAATHKSSLSVRHNVGGRSMEVLCEIAERRPEFRAGNAVDVVPAILSKFDEGEFWTGTAEAFKVALQYLDALQEKDVRDILSATLALLDKADPSRETWVIVQPAVDLLVAPAAQKLSKNDKDLDSRIVAAVLRFGLNQKTEHTRLLFYLYQFDLRSVYLEPMATQLKEVVRDVRSQALTINASNSTDNVRALLLASSAAGLDGIKDALTAIRLALDSVFGDPRHVVLAFPYAYQALIILAERQEQIARDISVSVEEFRSWLRPLLDQVVAVWWQAVKSPSIFAPFAFPPRSAPSPIIVHNWAFGSIALAKSLGEKEKVLLALARAAEEPLLRGPISSARAVRLGPGELEGLDPALIRSDDAKTFYSALGQRLVSLQYVEPVLQESIMDSLLGQCLRLGPSGLDAAVFLAAGQVKLGQLHNATEYLNYVKRLENNRELRLSLMPFLADRIRE